jgi:hypothetical protein
MRDLQAIELSVDACVLRARINAQSALEYQLRQVKKDLALVSASVPFSNPLARLDRTGRVLEALRAAADRATIAGDLTLAADIHRAAGDLRTWYRLDPTS